MNTVTIFVPGILNLPGSNNWVGKAVTHTHVDTGQPAEKVEYFTSALLRPLGQTSRAKKLARVIGFYQGWNIDLVGHSNGTDVILDGLEIAGWPTVRHLHLIAAACKADFDKNGLNSALQRDRVESVSIYIGEKDLPLKLAGTLVGRLLGYGTLGRTGAKNNRFEDRVREVRFKEFGHSSFFTAENFGQTMDAILQREWDAANL